MEIDHYSDVPAYVQVADQIRQGIADGTWAPGEAIPSIARLVQETGLAVATVRRGIELVEKEGLVRAVPGRGTYVTESGTPGQD